MHSEKGATHCRVLELRKEQPVLMYCSDDTHGAHTDILVEFKINTGFLVGTIVGIEVLAFEDVL